MLSASCPSCGSPITFRHASALTVVCEACSSCVVREGADLADHGKVARLPRDLSPLRIGARGEAKGGTFEVIGVIRRAKDHARWNEWCLQFSDDTVGWLGEGNGQFQLFTEEAEYPDAGRLRLAPGAEVPGPDGRGWVVAEVSEAAVVAAEGALPYPIFPGEPRRYADLRKRDGAQVATLDLSESPAVFYTGRVVDLPALKLVGLRPFAGWSDPSLVAFEGPEITAVRALQCPGCGAALKVRAPGLTQRLACEYCGAAMDIHAEGDLAEATLLGRAEAKVWKPRLPLGSRGTLQGVEWEVIGAMIRFVREDGVDYPWTEYFLFNPYRGSAWLVEDGDGHWSFVNLLPCLPAGGRSAKFKGEGYRKFQAGQAIVRTVLGEFTWEVQKNDTASTVDYVAPPNMLSMEHFGDEVTWSHGTWLPADTVALAFKIDVRSPEGVAPHQPNPYDGAAALSAVRLRFFGLAVAAAAVVALAVVMPARESLLSGQVEPPLAGAPYLSQPIKLAEESVVAVEIENRMGGSPDLVATFFQVETGLLSEWTMYDATSSELLRLPAGTWQLRVEPAPTYTSSRPGSLTISVVRDPGGIGFAAIVGLFALCAPIAAFLDRSGFEARRWAKAGE